MRTDEHLSFRHRDFESTNQIASENPFDQSTPTLSLSGHERNHLFMNAGGEQFYEVSGISGLDDDHDGRVFSLLDYDRDGWLDIASVNSNAPLFQLYHNEIAAVGERGGGKVVALRFVGGNHTSSSQPGLSPRDGYGAVAQLDLGGSKRVREFRCGEGMATQNSDTLLVGVGSLDLVPGLQVRWPGGRVQDLADIPAGTLVTVYEDPAQSPTGQAFTQEPYHRSPASSPGRSGDPLAANRIPIDLAVHGGSRPKLRAYTTMATWCASCKGELPQIARLREAFAAEDVELYGVPIDLEDDRPKLEKYLTQSRPAYELLTRLSEAERVAVNDLAERTLKKSGLPATLITDADGRVLEATWGAPSISLIRKHLRASR